MKPTHDWLKHADRAITTVFQAVRPELLAAHGKIEHELKEDNSVVTDLDKSIELKLREALKKFDSSIGLWGEEHAREGNTDTFWLIDPIDGTESFIRGLPSPRNMVTLIDHGQVVHTLVYKFVTDQLYQATAGQGSVCNDQPVHVSDRPLSRAWIEIAMPFDKANNAKRLANIRSHINGFAITFDFPLVAHGYIDGFITCGSGGGPWDWAPRALLIQEAGGKVANLGSTEYDYRNHDFIATNPIIFDKLMELMTAVA